MDSKEVQGTPPTTDFRTSTTSAAALIPNVHRTGRMLADMGKQTIAELFADIPADVRIDGLDLPPSMSEQDLVHHLATLAARNHVNGPGPNGMPVFLGAGAKAHYIPATVPALISRSEFYTSYTPYQPEVSQGILQALFEFQSIVCNLTQMDVANISQYDWATGLGEAALLAARAGKGNRFLVPENLTKEKRSVLENYTNGAGIIIDTVPYDRKTGTLDMAALETKLGDDVIGLYVETPNLFGLWEPEAPALKPLLDKHDSGLLVVGVDPLSLAVAQGPGAYGADIVIGEMAGYGTPLAYGGPLLGMFAVTKKLVRKMPGRVVGLAKDSRGNHAFTLTLQTREQHIRRERAMSNICTNETLLAVAATMYFGLMGGQGLTDLALNNEARARNLFERLGRIDGVTLAFDGATFDEATLLFDVPYEKVHDGLLAHGVHGGIPLKDVMPDNNELAHSAVFATTELHSDADHDKLVDALTAVMKEVRA